MFSLSAEHEHNFKLQSSDHEKLIPIFTNVTAECPAFQLNNPQFHITVGVHIFWLHDDLLYIAQPIRPGPILAFGGIRMRPVIPVVLIRVLIAPIYAWKNRTPFTPF